MHRLPLALVILLLASSAAQAQPEPERELVVHAVAPQLPHDGTPMTLAAQWEYASQVPLVGNATITWSLACLQGDFELTGDVVTEIEFDEASTEASGTFDLRLRATAAAVGLEEVDCLLHARLASPIAGRDASAEENLQLVATYRPQLNITVDAPSRSAGPQKQIVYSIRVENQGNARTAVQFELIEHPKDWIALVPEQVQLDAGQALVIPFIVATPYENGYNKDDTDLRVRATPSAWVDPEQTGEPVEFSVHAKVDGFYVPGPGLPLVITAVGLAMVLRSRR